MKWKLALFFPLFLAVLAGSAFFVKKTEYEHSFAVCAMFQNEAPYLKEWIDYHHKVLGASKFYLYNNESSDAYQAVLQPYIDQGLVELVDWENSPSHALCGWLPPISDAPWNDYQVGAYNDCLKNWAMGKVRWVAMLDIDEFLVPTNGVDSFTSLINKRDRPWPFSSPGSLKVQWKVFGTSHVWDVPKEKFLIETLYLRAQDDHGWNRKMVKSLHRPEGVDICLIHEAKLLHKGYKRRSLGSSEFNVHHYWTGTQKRLIEVRGCLPDRIEALSEEFNCVEDRTICQYLDKLTL